MDVLRTLSIINGLNPQSSSSIQRISRQERILKDRSNALEVYSDDDFRKRYRFSKAGFVHVLHRIEKEIKHLDNRGSPLRPDQQLLIALRYFASGSFQVVAGDLNGVSVATVCRTIQAVAVALVKQKNREIVFPTESELPSVMQKFSNLSKDNFPGIIGAIDCTHIPIVCPNSNDGHVFYNRKSFYSINCQVICDGNMMIRNIVARWPGSTHDSRIFDNCSIKQYLHQGHINGYLVGDSGYPCLPYLMTPFLNPQTPGERRYNRAHCRARNIIERLFGVWKRFPCIGSCLRTKLPNTLNIIIATAVLHNWAIKLRENDFFDSNQPNDQNDDDDDNNIHTSSNSGFASEELLYSYILVTE